MALLVTDPIDFYLDPLTHDLAFSKGDLQWSRGVPAVVQGIKIRLWMIKGEWFADLDEGIAYLERPGVEDSQVLLGRKFSQERARASMRPAILAVPGVKEILSLDPTFDGRTRRLSIKFSVSTVFGDTVADSLARTI